jgi:hypothetical protein
MSNKYKPVDEGAKINKKHCRPQFLRSAYHDEAAKERNTPKRTLRASVENEVQKLLPHGKAKRQTVANALG